jgi:lysozyme family protein
MMPSFDRSKLGYGNLWDKAKITSAPMAKTTAQRIVNNKTWLKPVEDETDVPWWLVGAWLYRESNLDFNTYLGNGQSLHHTTTEVPRDRGPWGSFLEGAVDAIKYEHTQRGGGFYKIGRDVWVLEYCLWASEEWNGEGYQRYGVNSPYVWSWTDLYAGGKFDRDGHFNPGLFDPQGGIAAILMALFEIDPTLMPKRIKEKTPMTDPTPTAPAPGLPPQLVEITKTLEVIVSFLPTVAGFFPPLAVALPFVPLIEGALKLAEELETAPHDPAAIGEIIIKHLQNAAANVQALKLPTK